MARFHSDRAAMFDLARTGDLAALFTVPREQRDGSWLERFYDAAWFASVELAGDEAFSGPDGMPYLRLTLPREGVPFDSQCLANLAGACLDRGIGAAFFAAPGEPPEAAQFVFPYGVIDSMVRYDSPNGDPVDLDDWSRPPPAPPKRGFLGFGKAKEAPREVLVATPSADYLPPHAARALHHYLTVRWELDDPHIALLVDAHQRPSRNLVIGRKFSSFGNEGFVQDLMRYTSWYLPPARGLALMPEDWSLGQMTPLRALC